MKTLIIFRGLPGCGKSTEAAALVKREPGRWIRINRDDIRSMIVGPGNHPHSGSKVEREEFVRNVKNDLIRLSFKNGYDVIVDDTHLVKMTVEKLHKLCADIGDIKVIEKGINLSIEECIRRDSQRTGFAKVGEDIIKRMASGAGIDKGRQLNNKETYYPPKFETKPIIQNESLPKAIICDLDGTLAIIGDRSPYNATDCDIIDSPNWPVIDMVRAMYETGTDIIFVSARDKQYRPETERFIIEYCKNRCSPKPPFSYRLYMRGDTAPDENVLDQRKDSVIKHEIFEKYIKDKYFVRFVIDDRNQVVDYWRSIGLTCFQCAPGDF